MLRGKPIDDSHSILSNFIVFRMREKQQLAEQKKGGGNNPPPNGGASAAAH